MVTIAKITRWAGNDIDAGINPRWYGTVVEEIGCQPGFLSIGGFESWPEDYDTYHAPLPNHSSWEEIEYDDLPATIRQLRSGEYSLKDHIEWMLEE